MKCTASFHFRLQFILFVLLLYWVWGSSTDYGNSCIYRVTTRKNEEDTGKELRRRYSLLRG